MGGSKVNVDSLKEKAISWLFQQGISTVLLVAILLYGARMSQYIIDVAVPAYIKSIVDGFDKQALAHEKVINKISDEWSKERELTRMMLRELQDSRSGP